MLEGTRNIFQSIWSLVGAVIDHKSINKIKLKDCDTQKLDDELFKTRNSAVSMVIQIICFYFLERFFKQKYLFKATFNISESFNLPSYLISTMKLAKFLKVSNMK